MDEQHLALADLDAVLRVRPDSARALSLRGIARFNLGQVTKAREDFQKSVATNPNDAVVWNNKGFFHYKINEYDVAFRMLQSGASIELRYKEAQYNLGLALKKRDVPELTTAGSTPDYSVIAVERRGPDLNASVNGNDS